MPQATRRIRCPSYWGVLTASALLALPCPAAQAQAIVSRDVLAAQLDRYMSAYVAMRDFNGRILVAVGDSVLFEGGFTPAGVAASTTATRYGIGSLTKTFTAAAIEALAKQGKLRLSDTVARFLPEYSHAARITIAQLLGHSAGVPDYYSQADYREMRTRTMSTASFARWIGSKPLEFEPGTRSNYSNSGYALLAGVIERASGLSYAAFVEQALLGPAGLTETGQLLDVRGSLAAGYNPGPPPTFLQTPVAIDLSWLTGSGSMYSTTHDLFRWTRTLQMDRRFARPHGTYPFGWGVGMVAGDSVVDQTGRIPIGYTSQVSLFTGHDVTIVILSAVQADVVRQIRDDVAAMLFGRTFTTPTMRPRPIVADSALQRYAGRFEIAPGFVLSVRKVGNGLELAGPDGDFLPLDALGDNTFFFRPLYVPITFQRGAQGWDVLDWNGAFSARRIP